MRETGIEARTPLVGQRTRAGSRFRPAGGGRFPRQVAGPVPADLHQVGWTATHGRSEVPITPRLRGRDRTGGRGPDQRADEERSA